MHTQFEIKIKVPFGSEERIAHFESFFKMPLPAKARVYMSEDFMSRIQKAIAFIAEPTFHEVHLSSSVRGFEDSSRIEFLDEAGQVLKVPYYSDFGEEEHRKVTDENRVRIKCDTLYGVTCDILFVNAFTEMSLFGRIKELSAKKK